jgi:hypothetical protein
LLLLDLVQAALDAAGQAAELLLGEPPFCSSRFRWIDARTSANASAIRTPGGFSGPPWSSLRIPRTAAQYSSTTASAESVARGGGATAPAVAVIVTA